LNEGTKLAVYLLMAYDSGAWILSRDAIF